MYYTREQAEQYVSDRFNSYVVKNVKKKRKCLAINCRKTFLSNSAGDRKCAQCKIKEERLGAMAEGMRR